MTNNEPVIIYDLVSVPNYNKEEIKNLKELFKTFREQKLILWDSMNGGAEPRVIPLNDFKVKDTNETIK